MSAKKNKAQKTEKMSAKKNNKYINKFVLNLQDGIVSDEMLNSYFCNTLFGREVSKFIKIRKINTIVECILKEQSKQRCLVKCIKQK